MSRPSNRVIAAFIAGLVVLCAAAALAISSGDSDADDQAITTTTVSQPSRTTRPPQEDVEEFLVADAIGMTVDLYSEPGVVYADKPWLDNPTHEGLPVVFHVLDGDVGDEYLKVRVSARPNGLTAFVKAEQVSLRRVPNRVVVEVAARRVTVYNGDEVLLQETAAVGTERTPTPLGEFFVDGIVDLDYKGGAYGAMQVSVSGFSDVLTSFGGGNGQIALHGTNRPDQLGQPVSNGCIRLDNDAITALAWLAPTGTPVEIVA